MPSSSPLDSLDEPLPSRYLPPHSANADEAYDDASAQERLVSLLSCSCFDLVRVSFLRESLYGTQALRSPPYHELYPYHTLPFSSLTPDQRQALVNHLCDYFRWEDEPIVSDLHDAIRSAP
jgi:hypothetical protein